MRRLQRIVLLATIIAVVPVLSGCANFDPESLDIFGLGEKKKLPGERRPVFPEGVPGVSQGIPKEYIKGNQPPPIDAAQLPPDQPAPAAAPAEEAKPEAEPKAEPKPKPKRKVAAKPKPAAPAEPVAQQPQQQQQAAPPAWPQGSTPPASPSGSTAAWPAPPPAGTFQR